MRVPVELGPTFAPRGTPEELFVGNYQHGPGETFDVHPDGERFLMVKWSDESATLNRIVLVKNWHEELTRLVPPE